MSQTKLIINNNGYRSEYILERFGKDAITFGSDTRCDIVLNNAKVSAYHGYIYRYNGKWYIKDQNSLNGILINGVKITESELRNGARVTLDRFVANDSVTIYFQENNTGYQPAMQYNPQGNAQRNVQGAMQRNVQGTPQRNVQGTPPRNVQNQKKDSESKKGSVGLALGIISLVLVIGFIVVASIFMFGKDDEKKAEGTTETTTVAESTEEATEATTEANADPNGEMSGEEVFNLANPSTVEIIASVSDQYGSLGSGFYIDTDGTVVTNYHVIDQARSAVIKTSDGVEYEVTGIKGYDPDLDLAILETTAGKTVPLERKTDEVNTGEKVYALGNPQGYQSTFTEGIVSSASREVNGKNYIQHTAPITNGNSGGPLLDDHGKIIGINTWVMKDGQNLNFAIPIDDVDKITTDGTLSLEQVYGNVYGESNYQTPSSTSDWKQITLAENGSRTISVSVPYEAEMEEENGTKSASVVSGNGGINVSGEIELGDYSNVTDDQLAEMDDQIISEMSGEINEHFDSGCQTSAEGCTINGRYWRLYTFSGTSNSYETDVYLMISYESDALAYVYVVSMSTDEAIGDTSQKVIDILSSVDFR